MSRIASGILFLFVSWLLPQPSIADPIIYDNNVTINSAFGDPVQNVFLADNFQLTPGQTTVADVHWQGVYIAPTAPTLPNVDAFAIRIFADNPNPAILSPFGAPILGLLAFPSRTDTGTLLGSFHIYEYSFDLPFPLTLLADTTYWLSIDYLGPLADDDWFWGAQLTAPGPGHAMFTTTNGFSWLTATFQGSPFEMDFRLTGLSAVVPEPATLALLGLGLLGLGFARRG